MQTRRAVLGGGLGLFAAAAVPARAQNPVTVTMWTFLDPSRNTGREVALRQMIESFERANPGIKVRVEPQVFSELMAKFLAGHTTGSACDIIWVNTENMGALTKSGAGADLEAAFLKNWTPAQKNDFFVKAGWDAGLVGARRYAVPLFHATTSIAFRRDLFAAQNIDPASIKTWDQLAEAAKKLTVTKDGRVDVWGFGTPLSTERTGGTTAFTAMMLGGGPVWDGCKPLYAKENGQKSVQWHVDLIAKHNAMPREVVSNNADDITDQFTGGRYAMAVIPFARYEIIAKNARWGGQNLGILPWPNWTSDKPGPQQVQGWWAGIWSRSRRIPEAAKFLEHLISPDSVRLWTRLGGQVPTRGSVWNEPEFQDQKYAFMRNVVEGWRAWSFLVPLECNTGRFDADWNQATQRVLVGGMPLDRALKEAERAFTDRQ